MRMLLGYAGAVTVGSALFLLVAGFARRQVRAAGLAHLEATTASWGDSPMDRPLPVRLVAPLSRRLASLGRRLTPSGRGTGLRRRLDHAGVAAGPEAFYAARAIALASGALLGILAAVLLGQVLSGRGLLIVLAGTALGAAVPDVALLQATQRRAQTIDLTLPEALDLMALSVQAGLGLEQAIAEVTEELPGALGAELDRMLKEQQLGRSRAEALTALRHRTRSEELARLVGALLHAERLGTSVATTLQVQARELRRRRRANAREKAGKAPVKLLFPLIFGIFPAMFVVILGPGALTIIEALLQR